MIMATMQGLGVVVSKMGSHGCTVSPKDKCMKGESKESRTKEQVIEQRKVIRRIHRSY